MSPHHSGRTPSGKKRKQSRDQKVKTYTEILLFILLPWFFVFLAKLLHTGVYIAYSGVIAIVSITLVKLTRFKPLVFVSVFSILILLMALVWQWTDLYMIPIITTEITGNLPLFTKGLYDMLIAIALVIIYQRQLTHLRMKINYDWYASKTYRKFIRIVVYFILFLLLFWIFAYIFHKVFKDSGYETNNITISAAIVSFVISGTLAVLWFIRPPAKQSSKRHHHRHRHHHSRSDAPSQTVN